MAFGPASKWRTPAAQRASSLRTMGQAFRQSCSTRCSSRSSAPRRRGVRTYPARALGSPLRGRSSREPGARSASQIAPMAVLSRWSSFRSRGQLPAETGYCEAFAEDWQLCAPRLDADERSAKTVDPDLCRLYGFRRQDDTFIEQPLALCSEKDKAI